MRSKTDSCRLLHWQFHLSIHQKKSILPCCRLPCLLLHLLPPALPSQGAKKVDFAIGPSDVEDVELPPGLGLRKTAPIFIFQNQGVSSSDIVEAQPSRVDSTTQELRGFGYTACIGATWKLDVGPIQRYQVLPFHSPLRDQGVNFPDLVE